MVVYIEYVAINNFIIDCLLILSARKAMNPVSYTHLTLPTTELV